MIKLLENAIFAIKPLILTLLAIFTAIMFWFAINLRIDAGFEKQLPAGHEYIETFQEYRDKSFGANRIIVVLRNTQGDIWNPETLAMLNGVTQDIFFLPGIDRRTVQSLWTPNTRFFEITEEGIRADDVIGGTTTPSNLTPQLIDKIRSNVVRGGLVGRLVSNDFTAAMVVTEINEWDQRANKRTDYFELGAKLEAAIRSRFEGAGGPALSYFGYRLDELVRLAGEKCPPDEGFIGKVVSFVGSLAGGSSDVPECATLTKDLLADVVKIGQTYGPTVGPWYQTFEQKLREIDGQNLDPNAQYSAVSALLGEWAAASTTASTHEVHIIGFSKAMADIAAGAREVIKFFIIAFILTVLSVFYYCRSWKLTWLTVGCSLTSVIWQFGLLTILDFGLDPLAILVPFLVFAIGVSHGVQQLNLISEGLAEGLDPEGAARKSFSGLLVPGSMALITDMVGFATLYFVPITMIQELAVTASIGVALKVITNLIMLPVVASYLTFDEGYKHRVEKARSSRLGMVKYLGVVAEPKVSFPLFLIYTFVFGYAVFQSTTRHIGNLHAGMPELKAEHRYNQDAEVVAQKFSIGLELLTVVIETPPLSCVNYHYMNYIDRFSWYMQNQEGVVSVISLAYVAKQLNAGWYEGNLKWRAMPRIEPSLVQATTPVGVSSGLLDTDCTYLPVQVFLRDGKAETIKAVVAAVEKWNETESVTPALSAGFDSRNGVWTMPVSALDGLTFTPQYPDTKNVFATDYTFDVMGFATSGAGGSMTFPIADLGKVYVQSVRPFMPEEEAPKATLMVTVKGASGQLFAGPVEITHPKQRTNERLDLKRLLPDVTWADATEVTISSIPANIKLRREILSDAVSVSGAEVLKPMPLDVKAALGDADLSAVSEIDIGNVPYSLYVRLASGNSGVAAAVNQEIEHQELPMTLAVYAVIIILVIFTFLDWRATVCCTVPLTFATFFGYWFMNELEIGLKVSTLPVMVLAVGIGVDYAFYIYNRLQYHLAHGMTVTESYKEAVLETGNAVIFTAVTLAIGVSTWAFSDLKFQADMGLLLTFMFVINMFNAVTALPAMAVVIEAVFPRKKRPRVVAPSH
ncbi:MAG TPA: efflux RND transporter permease subunit [Micropepsaceae bacterium]|nr:efflux RND transporter permease subunit [Micropepsaceae bacterium]